MQPIILYDTPSKTQNGVWAPNPGKTRQVVQFCLAYKGLPHTIVWVEFKDIPKTMKEIGASTTEGGRYTLPVIKDPNTGSVVADSWAIAEYLDKTYPGKEIIPRGTSALISLFEPAFCSTAYGKVVNLILTKTLEIMKDTNREYFIQTRLELLGESRWETVTEANAQQQWEELKKGLDEIDKWYQKGGGKWIMGDTFSFADMVVACRMMWWNTIFDKEQLRELHSWNGGRWAHVLADVNAECGTNLF
ncbi:uncharacterized protein EDB93DRAFT_1250595 [Suillus bovinus]|uniref:uncharacterized protein n=1 Tax=Suillus bovinus TaxID=48563 RepID=UPI001B862B93|nr:uncharacterized protein EDB93DRAFT_1250595 [Suillus bovinus]KAG2147450.1 hypothetical protein EDB93DRAFT_1250595 [Suillus bovinus]